jgi:glycine cleavage system aminomethyltransferase T
VRSIALDRPIGMAYLQRDFLEPGTTVSVEGHGAIVTSLPFVTRQ